MALDFEILGRGVYSPQEAARLVGILPRDVLRWTRGSGPNDPLWNAQYQCIEDSTEISFIDLVEVRVVAALRNSGTSLQAIRFAIDFAQVAFGIARPLASLNFFTDGKEILIEALEKDGQLTSLKKHSAGQKVFRDVVDQSLKGIEFSNQRPVRWWPEKTNSIVIDPSRSFGTPILSQYGISTTCLYNEFEGMKNIRRLAKLYEVPEGVVRKAIKFEQGLNGQSSL